MSDPEPHIPVSGARQDVEGDEDYAYFDLGGKPKRQPQFQPLTSQQVDQIEEALKEMVRSSEGKSPREAMAEAMDDRRGCPLCPYVHFNVFTLGEHVRDHAQVKAFLEQARQEQARYEGLQRKRQDIKVRLQVLRNQLIETDEVIERFDFEGHRQRQAQVSRLLRILPARYGSYRSFSTSVKT